MPQSETDEQLIARYGLEIRQVRVRHLGAELWEAHREGTAVRGRDRDRRVAILKAVGVAVANSDGAERRRREGRRARA